MNRWPERTLAERFWEKVDQSGGPEACWLWTAATNNRGYGLIGVNGRKILAHRLAYELTHGPIPPEKPFVLHDCPGGDNPLCVRHLWLGTQADNVRDMVAKGRQRNGGLRGERHGMAKLTEPRVLEIRRARTEEGLSERRLALRFGVDRSTIQAILTGRNWGWLKESA